MVKVSLILETHVDGIDSLVVLVEAIPGKIKPLNMIDN
jgi:hypothetical protein